MSTCVIGFSGKMGSGKTTISSMVAQTLGWTRVSFGDYVRSVAGQRGLDEARETLQALGQALLENSSEDFCRAVLAQAGWRQGQSLIVDGVRHVEVVDALRLLVKPTKFLLVLVATDGRSRENRLRRRDGSGSDSFRQVEMHSTEVQLQTLLSSKADITVNGSHSPDELREEITTWINGKCLPQA